MKSLLRILCGLILVCCISAALAGGPDVPPPPVTYDGFYVGLGGTYNSLAVHHQDPFVAVNYQDYTSNLNKLAPIFQLGYWGMISDDFMFGVKAFYKYLNARPHLVYNAGGANIFTEDNEVDHEVALLLLFGVQVHDVLLYLGGGVVVFPSTQAKFHHTLAGGGFFTACNTFWGGIGQIGLNYYFNPWWFMDASYTYAQTSSVFYNTTVGTGQAPYHLRYSIVNQEFIFTLNRRF